MLTRTGSDYANGSEQAKDTWSGNHYACARRCLVLVRKISKETSRARIYMEQQGYYCRGKTKSNGTSTDKPEAILYGHRLYGATCLMTGIVIVGCTYRS